jgi:DNA-binding transcriptional regulator YhcF (GntR family)
MAENPPPYLRIAAALHRRILAGDLAPGDRLPSTRALAAEWRVAPGTAAKALAELQRLGVARAQPRVGTVVMARRSATPRGDGRTSRLTRHRPESARGAEQELTRERLVRAAIAIADAEGLEALSMRAVAARLGVATMSPYRHVGGKDELILLMADSAYGEARYPAQPVDGWRARLEAGARILWRLYRRHPWLAQLGPLARPLLLPNLLRHTDWVVAALNDLGLPAKRILDLQILLYSHGLGLAVNLDREARARADTGLSDEQWVQAQTPRLRGIASSGHYPHFASMLQGLGDGYDFDLDALFELGLQALLDGFERLTEHVAPVTGVVVTPRPAGSVVRP